MSINKKKQKKIGHQTYSLSSTSFSLKMASRNKLLPVWDLHLGNTRAWIYTWWGIHVGGKGVLSMPREKNLKISNFVCQSYLRIFP
jgi:hypothetical protein